MSDSIAAMLEYIGKKSKTNTIRLELWKAEGAVWQMEH